MRPADAMRAPGCPGVAPTWSSSDKDLVMTALGPSRLWATLGHGIVNEVYYPTTGQPQIRDLGFIVAGSGGWHEVKRVARYDIELPEPFVPLPTVSHVGDGYRLVLEMLPDPEREVLLIRYRLDGAGVRLHPLLAPHLGARSGVDTAWVDAGGLRASGGVEHLCLVASGGFARASAGYVGQSDGWQDFARNGRMTWTFERADEGNVALMGELAAPEGILALGFASSVEGARVRALSSLAQDFAEVREHYVDGWRAWGRTLALPDASPAVRREAYVSAMVLKVHEDKGYPGAVVASLCIPWGSSRDDLGGYHLVWPRDAVEAALGFVASGQTSEARRVLTHLVATQHDDGHWSQNFYPDGRAFWQGIQLDEVGLPVVLAAKLREIGALGAPAGLNGMVRRALAYLARHGPISPQDRWEENAGTSPFTLAVEVAALVAGAPWLEDPDRSYALSLADCWNERIEEWTFVRDGRWAAAAGVDGYYVRVAPPVDGGALRGCVDLRNRAGVRLPADAVVGLDFGYLARLGLRAADDPAMVASVRVVDAVLRVETPSGPSFHRYNGDGYGEHSDGSPFDGTGVGRAWPLLTGERGHLALLRGEGATSYLDAMCAMTGRGGLIPEQIWDAPPIPSKGLHPGKPSGSAMPLVWAHAEFLKLLRATERGRPIELLDAVEARWGVRRPTAHTWHWRAEAPFRTLPRGRELLVEGDEPFVLHVGFDGWDAPRDLESTPLGLGMHGVRLPSGLLAGRRRLDFTRFFRVRQAWEGADRVVDLPEAPS